MEKSGTVLMEVLRSLFEEIDIGRIRREVGGLRNMSPDWEPRDHARALARRTALRCAAAGAATGFPSGMVAIATLGADLSYLVHQQFRLILGIATIYGHEPGSRERFREALVCVALGSGVGIGKRGIAVAIESLRGERKPLARRAGSCLPGERLGKMIPAVGAISGGALNYFVVRAIANATIRYYEALVDPRLAEEIWAEGDREHA